MTEKNNRSSAGFLSYAAAVILLLAVFIMMTTTVLSNKFQERGQMKQCEDTVVKGVYYSPVCFFGEDYEYTKAQ